MQNEAENKQSGFGILTRENGCEWCKGAIALPSLSKCQIRFSVWWDGEIFEEAGEREPENSVDLLLFNETDCAPSEAQNEAHRYLMENQDEVAAALMQTLHEVSAKNIQEARSSISDVELLKAFDEGIANNQLDGLEGVEKQVELIGVGFLEQEKEGLAYISFDFNCGWDDEHGVSVFMNKNEVLAVGGCSEFYHRGEELEAHIKIIQS